MKIFTLIFAIMVAIAFVNSAIAVKPDKSIEFAGGENGKVVFSGTIHADKELKCNDCHPKLFKMKKGTTKITKEDHGVKFCGECHNGTKAFSQKDNANCTKCHKK